MSLQMELKNFLWDLQGEGVEVRDAVRDIFSYNALIVTIIVYFKETGSKICSFQEHSSVFLIEYSNSVKVT